MYREIIHNENSEILEKEPIDVLIKYIDLGDPDLKREGIKQIKKDVSLKLTYKSIPYFYNQVNTYFYFLPLISLFIL